MRSSDTDYDFSQSHSNVSQSQYLRPPGTPNKQLGSPQFGMSLGSGTPSKQLFMPNLLQPPPTSSGLGRSFPIAPPATSSGLGRSFPMVAPGTSSGMGGSLYGPGSPRNMQKMAALPSTPSRGGFQQPMAATLGGQPLNYSQNLSSPRSNMGSYGNTGAGMGSVPTPSFKSSQMPLTMQIPSRSVNSRTESKSDYSSPSRLVQAAGKVMGFENQSQYSEYDFNGSGYGHNQPAPPKNVSLPRPYAPPPNTNPGGRTAGGGRIYSAPSCDFADPVHVPSNGPRAKSALAMLEESGDNSVGPDRPTKALNDVWSACWDDEVKATYYYNHQTGEATWVLPDGL